jgi:ABC-type branched-subunit amino acid transport system ATPase component/ABC-type branched-subunit amino acid transport system permease subunit
MNVLSTLLQDRRLSWILLIAAALAALAGDYPAQTVGLGAVYAIALMGVDLVVGYAGMITVGHAALFGVGAYAAASLSSKLGLPMPLGLAAGVVLGALAGWLLSLPALKAQDKYVALATLVTGLAFNVLFIECAGITNGSAGITLDKRVAFGHALTTLDFALIGLALAGLCMVALNRLAERSIGRAFEAMRDSEVAADCVGVSPGKHKQIAFVLSGLFCGLAGALFAYSQGYVAPNTFGFDTSVTLLLASMLGGKKTRSGALLGAAVVIYLPVALNSVETFQWIAGACVAVLSGLALRSIMAKRDFALCVPAAAAALMLAMSFNVAHMVDWRQIIYGVLILAVTYYLPKGLAGSLPVRKREVEAKAGKTALAGPARAVDGPALELRDVGMSFGGFVALSGVSLSVMPAEILGIVGPNGAGKSTLMNVITGVYEPTSGRALVGGVDNAGLDSACIARHGVARTFQNLQVFGGLSAIENVMVGLHRAHEGRIFKLALGLGKSKDACAADKARALLDFVGLSHRAGDSADSLSYGEKRFLEIARALGSAPGALLLDEPAAGLAGADLERMKALILDIAKSGVAVLVIEHHMDLIREVSHRVLALNSGSPMAPIGAPDVVLSHPDVIAAYLGI